MLNSRRLHDKRVTIGSRLMCKTVAEQKKISSRTLCYRISHSPRSRLRLVVIAERLLRRTGTPGPQQQEVGVVHLFASRVAMSDAQRALTLRRKVGKHIEVPQRRKKRYGGKIRGPPRHSACQWRSLLGCCIILRDVSLVFLFRR